MLGTASIYAYPQESDIARVCGAAARRGRRALHFEDARLGDSARGKHISSSRETIRAGSEKTRDIHKDSFAEAFVP